jgi:hypothetical protein
MIEVVEGSDFLDGSGNALLPETGCCGSPTMENSAIGMSEIRVNVHQRYPSRP